MEILCFDASGSTSKCEKYWNTIERLTKANKFDALLSWSHSCREVKNIYAHREFSTTNPSAFVDHILRNFNKVYIARKYGEYARLTLHVTTDGQIPDSYISHCADYLRKPNFPPLKQVTIHYIGNENVMNLGLNAIFGSVTNLSFTVNDIDAVIRVLSARELEDYEDIFSDEFQSYLCSRIHDIKTNDYEGFDRLRRKLIAKIDKKRNDLNKPIEPKEYYEKNDAEGLEKAIRYELFNPAQTEFQIRKNRILSCFDKISNISLSSIRASGDLKSTVLTDPDTTVESYDLTDEDTALVETVEDSITFENIDQGKIFLLVKFSDEAALFEGDSKYTKNPFLVFEDSDICNKLVKQFEFHPFSIESIRRLVTEDTTIVTSPFTRATCRAFILGPSNMDEVNFNSLALATFFRSGEKQNIIYGNKLLWNFVILYLIKSHIDSTIQRDEIVTWPRDELCSIVNAIVIEFVFNDTLYYDLTLHVTLGLPVKRVPLYVALWYIIVVAPLYATNSTRNVLRYPGSSILFDIFVDLNSRQKIIPFDENSVEKLRYKVKLWRLWSEMLARRNDSDLRLLIRSAYQNSRQILGKIVLLSGPRPDHVPVPELVDGIPPSIVEKMWHDLKSNSTRVEAIEEDGDSLEPPKCVILSDDTREFPEVYHMQIDPETLRPLAICPVTNKPAHECSGEFDIKSESFARIFSLYCQKYDKYPENYQQLVLLHNRKRARDNVSHRYIEKYMKHVFEIHQSVATTMPCNEFVKKYAAVGTRPKHPMRKKKAAHRSNN